MNWFKRIFKKKKKEQFSDEYYQQLHDMPTLIDFALGRASLKWKQYFDKWYRKND